MIGAVMLGASTCCAVVAVLGVRWLRRSPSYRPHYFVITLVMFVLSCTTCLVTAWYVRLNVTVTLVVSAIISAAAVGWSGACVRAADERRRAVSRAR